MRTKSPVVLNRNKVSLQDSLCNLTPPDELHNNFENLNSNERNIYNNKIKTKKPFQDIKDANTLQPQSRKQEPQEKYKQKTESMTETRELRSLKAKTSSDKLVIEKKSKPITESIIEKHPTHNLLPTQDIDHHN